MHIEVRYYTKNGGTKKLAEAIAAAVGAQAQTVETPLDGRADILFLGASVYGGRPDPSVTAFIRQNARDIGRIVVFGSACTGKSTHAVIKAIAADCAVRTAEMFFQCRGQFWFFNKNRPNDADCAAAAEFAKKQVQLNGVT